MLAGIWPYLKFTVFEEARAQMGGKKGERRKVRASFCLGRYRSWTDMSVPLGSEPNTIMEMYLPSAVLDFTKIFIPRTKI